MCASRLYMREILKLLFLLICGILGQPVKAQDNEFSFKNGIGFKHSGPIHQPERSLDWVYPRAERSVWWQPKYSVDAFSRLDEIWPARIVKHGKVKNLSRKTPEPPFSYVSHGFVGSAQQNLDDYFRKNPVTGLILVQDGQILVERYQYNRNDRQRMTSFSMAKTLIAMMVGIAVHEGRIRSIEDKAELYVKSLGGTAYGETPLRHLLTMSSGVKFREDYDGQDDAAQLSRATIMRQTIGGAEAVKPFNQRVTHPGDRWNYASAETYVLALVLRAAIGRPLSDYFSEKIWIPIGAEAEASFLIDASGNEVGYMGFNAVLRDYARLGIMMAQKGRVGDKQIIPQDWWHEMTHAHFQPAQTRRWFGYGFQIWTFPNNDGSFAFLGVRGQSLFVDPTKNLVLVQTAVRVLARDPGSADTNSLWRSFQAHDIK